MQCAVFQPTKWASLPPGGSPGGQNECDLPGSVSSERPLCFCFCIKKMFLLSSHSPTSLCSSNNGQQLPSVCVSFVNSCHVVMLGLTKPRHTSGVSCASAVYSRLRSSPGDSQWGLPFPPTGLSPQCPSPKWQGEGVPLEKAPWVRGGQTQLCR